MITGLQGCSPDALAQAPTDRCPSAFAMHSVTCAIGCAEASIPAREGQRTLSRRVNRGATANENDRGSAPMRAPRATPHAIPFDLRRQRNASDRELGSRLHPGYLDAIGRLPAGRQVFRGLPFGLARATTERRWLLLEREVVVDLRATGPVSHVVVAHFCDAWRDPVAGRPADLPIGWVTPGRPAPGPLHGRAGLRADDRRGHASAVRDQ